MEAINSVIGQCGGATVSLPTQYQPNLTATTWAEDWSSWQTFYEDISAGALTLATVTGDVTGWQAQANGWGEFIRAQCPNLPLPANFPSGQAGIASILPSWSTVGWVAFAVLVGAGLWFFWPRLVGARALL
jgi:hypothetical protein